MRGLGLVPVAVVASAAALGLSACGPLGGGTEDDVSETITSYLTDNDPSFCTELLTENFVEDAFKDQAACEKAMGDASANVDSVEVSSFQEFDETSFRPIGASEGTKVAQVEVDVEGPPVGEFGKHFLVHFEEQDGTWKILSFEHSK